MKVAACPVCGATNAPGARFCSACGTRLESTPAVRETRKTVTVLFADVTGSTALGEQLDPESLRRLMSRYFAEMQAIIERHGGTVEKFIGDAVMAVFGIPAVHEDDALRAVRAAADIRDRLAHLNAELTESRGLAIRFRTGLYTGEVVAGDATTGQTLVTGDTVNTAARLEQAAPPGEILIGRPTYSLVRDAVEAEPVEAVAAKGKAEPVPAYRLISVRPGLEGHARRFDAPLVGRDRELARLQEAFTQAEGERSIRLVTVLGAAGVGKSRLVAEFIASVSSSATVLGGRCLPYGEGITYWPIGEIVRAAAGIDEADTAEAARAKVRAVLEGEPQADVLAARVAAAIGLSAEPAPQEEFFWAIRTFLERLARERPLVAVVEDIHWAEPTLLDLLEYIADWSHDAPLLLLAPARADLLDSRPGWGVGRPNATTIVLEPLPAEATGRLIETLPGGEALPAAVVSAIQAAAEGNPLYIEEMLAMLVDDGLLTSAADGSWHAADTIADVRVPPTIRALLAARLDRLAPDERAVAQRASVVGRAFEQAAVAELTDEVLRPAVAHALLALVRKELLRPDRSELTAGDAFKFRHILIRDAAYDGLPKAERAELHERFASWLEGIAGDRITEFEEVLGYHLEQAYLYRTELGESGDRERQLAERAVRYLWPAGQEALEWGDPRIALGFFQRTRRLTASNSPDLTDLSLDLAATHWRLGESSAQAAAHAAAEAAAPFARTAGRRRLELERARMAMLQAPGDVVEFRRAIDAVVKAADDSGDEGLLVRGLEALAWADMMEGHLASSDELLRRAIDLDRAAGRAAGVARKLSVRANRMPPGPVPVPEGLRECATMLGEVADYPDARATVLLALGYLEMLDGQLQRGRERIAQAKDIADELGQLVPLGAADWPIHVGEAELLVGEPSRALGALAWAVEVLEGGRDLAHLASIAPLYAQTLLATGDTSKVRWLVEKTRSIAADDDLDAQVRWRLALGGLLQQEGSVAEGIVLLEEAAAAIRDSPVVLLQIEVELARVAAALESGDVAGAEAARNRALALARQKESRALIARITGSAG